MCFFAELPLPCLLPESQLRCSGFVAWGLYCHLELPGVRGFCGSFAVRVWARRVPSNEDILNFDAVVLSCRMSRENAFNV